MESNIINKKTTEEQVLNTIKYTFAFVIVTMGAIGYYNFFNNGSLSPTMLLIILMFVMVEVVIIAITTIKFSSSIKQHKSINIFLYMGIAVMGLIAGVGIDNNIWHLVEEKYKQVKQADVIVKADEINLLNLKKQLFIIKNQKDTLIKRQNKIENQKIATLKDIKKYDRNLRGIIFSVAKCTESEDCKDRKTSALQNKEISMNTLTGYNTNLNDLRIELSDNKKQYLNVQLKINTIKNTQIEFEKKHRLTVDNQKSESVTHMWIMNFFNDVFKTNIDNPQRVFVMILSFVIYPIYILFVMFAASNSVEMKEERKVLQEKNKKERTILLNVIKIMNGLLSKVIIYFIKTRNRKVKIIETEIEKEVEIEVEKIIYKDGKEIVEIEVEKAIIVEKEKIIEKIVHVPMIEKEFIIVPAGTDLNALNKLAKSGIVPEDLSKILENTQDSIK